MTLNFNIDPDKLAEVRASRGLKLPSESDGGPTSTPPRIPEKRRPGRPRKIVGPAIPETELQSESKLGFDAAPLISVDEKLFARRLEGFFTGVTGIGGVFIKDYLAMTPEEAEAIAEPLASYLIRRAPDSETVKQFVENYDLLAIVTGTAAYTGRVYQDRRREVEEQREARARAIRSPSNAASLNTTEEPVPFSPEQENPVNHPINTEPGPIVRISGQP
jgi:hypothetical protein